jgi:sterol 3beta-glucosyltransferase/vancomycin aglycone glucosyltransferase
MLMNAMFLGDANAFRATLGLAPKRDQLTAVFANGKLDLIASSPSLFPPPPDWGINYRQCGYLDLPEGSRTDRIAPPLSDFMGAGPPPIFITFGSLMPMDGATLRAHWDIFAEALERSDQRAIVQLPTLWSGVLPDCVRILPVRFVSHRRVFAQCAMVVHHGGAGTTHAAIGAGVPSIVVPHLADQFFWGAQLHKLGVAPTPIPLRRLSAARLAAAIDAVVAAPSMRRRAADIARSMDREHGVTEGVRLIEAFATTQPAVRSSAASRSI